MLIYLRGSSTRYKSLTKEQKNDILAAGYRAKTPNFYPKSDSSLLKLTAKTWNKTEDQVSKGNKTKTFDLSKANSSQLIKK